MTTTELRVKAEMAEKLLIEILNGIQPDTRITPDSKPINGDLVEALDKTMRISASLAAIENIEYEHYRNERALYQAMHCCGCYECQED